MAAAPQKLLKPSTAAALAGLTFQFHSAAVESQLTYGVERLAGLAALGSSGADGERDLYACTAASFVNEQRSAARIVIRLTHGIMDGAERARKLHAPSASHSLSPLLMHSSLDAHARNSLVACHTHVNNAGIRAHTA
jgi:hypothetical protein